MVFLMVSSKLLKHSVIVAIDYWLALWTSSKTNQTADTVTDVSNGTRLAEDISSNATLPTPGAMEAEVHSDFMRFFFFF